MSIKKIKLCMASKALGADENKGRDARKAIKFVVGYASERVRLVYQQLFGEHARLHVFVRPFPADVIVVLLESPPQGSHGLPLVEPGPVPAYGDAVVRVVVALQNKLVRKAIEVDFGRVVVHPQQRYVVLISYGACYVPLDRNLVDKLRIEGVPVVQLQPLNFLTAILSTSSV